MHIFARSSLAVLGFVLAACGGDGAGSPPTTPTPFTISSVTPVMPTTSTSVTTVPVTTLATTAPSMTTSSTTTSSTTTSSTTTSSTIPVAVSAVSAVTVADPTGDVSVATNGYGSLPVYDPRADLVSYTLSWNEVVTFSLTPVEIDPAMLDDVWLAFDTDADSSGLPEFAVFNVAGTNALYELQDMWMFTCPVRRSIVAGSYVVEFDAACLGEATELQLRSPYPWSYGVTGTVTGTTSPSCVYAPEIIPRPEWNCQPWASYTDEMPGSGPIVRSS